MKKMRRFGVVAILLFGVLSLSACLLAAAGTGAGGGVYFTSRGAKSVVPADVETVAAATNQAFEHFAIQRTELTVRKDGDVQEFIGKPVRGDREVTVKIRAQGPNATKVVVTARKSLVTWDKEYARSVIEKLAEFSKG